MFFVPLIAMLAWSQSMPVVGAACSGSDPRIVSAVASALPAGGTNTTYRVTVTVRNDGSQRQAGNVLQSVFIYQDDVKVGQKGVPPLAAGATYTFPYDFVRATDAGAGTTHLHFALKFTQPNPPGSEDCSTSNDSFDLKV